MKPGRIILAFVLMVGIGWAGTNRDLLLSADLPGRLEALGFWGPVAFVGLYAAAALLFLPGSVLTLSGGALFGPVLGTLYSLLGATIGATLAFLLARYVVGDAVRRLAGARLEALLTGVEEEGWRFVAFTRLVPLFPFNLLNYTLGVTRIRLLPYVLASAICMAPGAAAFTWLGHAGRQATGGGEGAIQAGLVGLALLSVVVFLLPRVVAAVRSARSAGEEAVEDVPVLLDAQERAGHRVHSLV